MNRRRGQSPGDRTEYVNCILSWAMSWDLRWRLGRNNF